MRIECFTRSEWLQIADIISAHCPSEPIIEKFISVIDDRTNLFSYAHEFFLKNNINPVFFPDRKTIEQLKNGKGLTKRLSEYSSVNGKGIIQFKKEIRWHDFYMYFHQFNTSTTECKAKGCKCA